MDRQELRDSFTNINGDKYIDDFGNISHEYILWIENRLLRFINKGKYIGSYEQRKFEKEISKYLSPEKTQEFLDLLESDE